MAAIPQLTEEEKYLAAVLDDPSGIELAELTWVDEEQEDRCYRLWDFQWKLYRCEETFQIDFMGRSLGKALDLDTPVPTPAGWTTMGELQEGDLVYGVDGKPTRITAAFETLHDRPCYQLTFTGQESIVADAGHLWTVRDAVTDELATLTTQEIVEGGLRARDGWRWSIETAKPTAGLRGLSLPVDPWLLGYWLGDGTARNGQITVGAQDIDEFVQRVEAIGCEAIVRDPYPGRSAHVVSLRMPDGTQFGRVLTAIGAKPADRGGTERAHKTIPELYFLASEQERWELLRGFMDADGHASRGKRASFDQCDELLARQLFQLVASLGERPTWREVDATLNGRVVGTRYRVGWTPRRGNPFGYKRKADRIRVDGTARLRHQLIAAEPVASRPVRCVTVDAPDHLFLVGHSYIPTHNSVGIQMRAFAFPFNYPGQEMLITAPQLNHLRPVVDKIESRILNSRLAGALLPKRQGRGINHQPQFQVEFINGARIMSRLPGPDGKGVKGCVAEGTLVLTNRGQVPVEEIAPGDQVLTHLGRWRPVIGVYRYEDAPGVEVAGAGHRGLQMSEAHRMLACTNKRPKGKRDLTREEWTILSGAEDPSVYYLGSPTTFPEAEVPWPRFDEEIAWVVGRYVADGFVARQTKRDTQTSMRLHIITSADDEPEVTARLQAAILRPTARLRDHNGTYDVEVSDTDLCRFVARHFGEHADGKEIPTWLLGAPEGIRRAFLEGYLSGDGYYDDDKGRWTASTASKRLAVGLRLLGQTLGYSGSLSWVDPKVTEICGTELKAAPKRSWRTTLTERGHALVRDGVAWQKIRKVTPCTVPVVYDIAVAEDHSYIADGLISHNMHPLVIEADEMQDFPENGWIELIETMKAYVDGAQWRCHGVSRGVRDRYYRYTMGEDPELPWHVHRYMAMHRPTWGPEERASKVAIYGGTEDNIDYRRNIYGEHGDVTNPLFVLTRLMACVRIAESKWATEYNDKVYAQVKVTDEQLGSGVPIENFIQLPGTHLDDKYHSYWAGMDVGFTRDPSEILIFGETEEKGRSLLRLLARIHMMRISAADQAAVVRHIFDYYGPRLRRFSMDKTGNGLPLWQELDPDAVGTDVRRRRTPEHISQRIRGYGFSNKVAVEFDDRELGEREREEDAVIEKNVISFAADELRKFVDTGTIELPYDQELLSEWQGQEIQYVRDEGSAAGHKGPSRLKLIGGSLHTLDAAFMMTAGKQLMAIEEALKIRKDNSPVLARFG